MGALRKIYTSLRICPARKKKITLDKTNVCITLTKFITHYDLYHFSKKDKNKNKTVVIILPSQTKDN